MMHMEVIILLHFVLVLGCEPGSQVSIVTGYGLGNRGLIPDRGREFFLYPLSPAGRGVHPPSCTVGTGRFPSGKVWLGRDADHSPKRSVEVKKEKGYAFSSPKRLSLSVVG
jgi:hypothetical protein